MVIIRVSFDIVDTDTNASLPLDQVYNHHLVIYSRIIPGVTTSRDVVEEAVKVARAQGLSPAAAQRLAGTGGLLGLLGTGGGILTATARVNLGLSAIINPCGVGTFFAGGGAEWRGRQAADNAAKAAGDPWLKGDHLWIEPPGTEWGANVHLIDLRDVQNLGDAVQCNCAAYGTRTPGTPVDFDYSPLPGGGIACCGDKALGPVTPAANVSASRGVSLLYNVTWLPNTTDALAKVPEDTLALLKRIPLQTTLMVSSSAKMDGASCGGEYNAKPCSSLDAAAAFEIREETRPVGPSVYNQTCADTPGDGTHQAVTVAWSHPFRLPPDAAYEVRWMVGHQHVGGRNIRFINSTAGANSAVLCESTPTYGTQAGVPGDERGFIVDMSRCEFNPPLLLRGGESYVLRSEYGADAVDFAPAAFPPPYEGVMGYMTLQFTVPVDAEIAAFSMSGNTTLKSTLKAAEQAEAMGACVISRGHAAGTSPATNATKLTIATKEGTMAMDTASAPDPHFTSLKPVVLETNGDATPSFVQLTPEHNFTMQWTFVDGGKNIAFKLRLEIPTWFSIGIHRPGGRGMPNADMIIVQSLDDDESFVVMEAWTMAYDRPRSKRFYGGEYTSGLSSVDCAVSVVGGVVEASFKRRAVLVDPADLMGANVTRGEATTVVWAFGEDGAGTTMSYHGHHAGSTMVTW